MSKITQSNYAKTTALKAIFGGTFDPPHLGHLQPLLAVLDALNLDNCELIPSHIPVHKTGCTSAIHRLRMTELFAKQDRRLQVNDIEIARDSPSFSAYTLSSLRRLHPDQAICFIMGMDAFLTLPSWFSPQSILQNCHLIVMMRNDAPRPLIVRSFEEHVAAHDDLSGENPGARLASYCEANDLPSLKPKDLPEISAELRELLPKRLHLVSKITQNAHNLQINGILRASKQGEVVFVLNEKTNISSTEIRHAIKHDASIKQWLSPEVADYIQAHRIYKALR